MIVDDEPLNCKLLSRDFAKAAHNLDIGSPITLWAANGQEAVGLMAASLEPDSALDAVPGMERRFNLLCMDRQIPVMDGMEAARQIKAMQGEYFGAARVLTGAQPAHVVGMSASISSPADWLAAGVDECHPKPFTMQDIEGLLSLAHFKTRQQRFPADSPSPGLWQAEAIVEPQAIQFSANIDGKLLRGASF
jgi:CheY-like chemotaxis protein